MQISTFRTIQSIRCLTLYLPPWFQARLTVVVAPHGSGKCHQRSPIVQPADWSLSFPTRPTRAIRTPLSLSIRRRAARCPSSKLFTAKIPSLRAVLETSALFYAAILSRRAAEVSNCTISPVSGWRMNLSKTELRSIGL